MNCKFEYLEDKDIVLVRTSGSYELAAEIETVKKAISKLKEHNCNKCIFDHRAANVIAGTLSSYDRPKVYKLFRLDHSVHTALVVRELNDDMKFYENVCLNRGWNVKIFTDYDAAIDWLAE